MYLQTNKPSQNLHPSLLASSRSSSILVTFWSNSLSYCRRAEICTSHSASSGSSGGVVFGLGSLGGFSPKVLGGELVFLSSWRGLVFGQEGRKDMQREMREAPAFVELGRKNSPETPRVWSCFRDKAHWGCSDVFRSPVTCRARSSMVIALFRSA